MHPLSPATPESSANSESHASAAHPEHPTRVGPYHLTHLLGSGSVGTSYLGAGPEGERVVVKVIHPELSADPDFHVRFVRESASAARMTAAEVYDVCSS